MAELEVLLCLLTVRTGFIVLTDAVPLLYVHNPIHGVIIIGISICRVINAAKTTRRVSAWPRPATTTTTTT